VACGVGKVTGGGKVVTFSTSEASFGFIAQRKAADGSPAATGHFNYNEPGLHVNGPVDTLIITGPNSATFSGTCGPGCTFIVDMEDNGEPNRDPNRDKLRVKVDGVPRNPTTPDVIKGNNEFHTHPNSS
jgi:hypothetical protein